MTRTPYSKKALTAMSDGDLALLEQVASLQARGEDAECNAEQLDAVKRYDEAYVKALSETNLKFTLSEMDQILGAE